MADKVIPLRELRNDISAILRAVEQDGATFSVTVRGKPVARLIPTGVPDGPRRFVDRETLVKMYADSPPDPTWLAELLEQRAEDDEDDTFPEYKDLP
jgi:prevent-host-death family protein